MPKRKDEENDNGVLLGIGAFLFGAALAQPSKDKVQKLDEFQTNERLFNYFKLHYNDFHSYLRDRKVFDEFKSIRVGKNKRWRSLGEVKVNERISENIRISLMYNEAIKLFLEGFFRSSCISCAILMEGLLKDKFGNKNLMTLIDEARTSNMISKSEKHHLNGIRLDRNEYVHSIEMEAGEEDARIVILITSKIINKLI